MNKTLDTLSVGAKARVKEVNSETALCQRLMQMGLLPNIEVVLTHIAPLGDPIAVEFAGRSLSLRRQEAAHVSVELLPAY
ncbi:MAG: FeoA family protein [Opitutales bacterium]